MEGEVKVKVVEREAHVHMSKNHMRSINLLTGKKVWLVYENEYTGRTRLKLDAAVLSFLLIRSAMKTLSKDIITLRSEVEPPLYQDCVDHELQMLPSHKPPSKIHHLPSSSITLVL